MRIGLGQINATVGDLSGNAERIAKFARQAQSAGCDLFVTPELAVAGYPPQDLLLKDHFVTDQFDLVHGRLAAELSLPSVIGFVDRDREGNRYNAAAIIVGGEVHEVVHKTLLPTYGVFDEWRYFKPASENRPVQVAGLRIGVTICEDLWDKDYERKVVPSLADQGAELILNLSSSPFHTGKRDERIAICRRHAVCHGLPVAYCNLVGAQDELIFDGDSFAVDERGRVTTLGPRFAEASVIAEFHGLQGDMPEVPIPARDWEAEVFGALLLGTADYCRKCGFASAVIGLSGGVDSALVACIAVEALGPKNVMCVAMPSPYTTQMSNEDARTLAANLGAQLHVLPIGESNELAMARYRLEFGDYTEAVTAENLQARERGKTLMEISNDRHALVLATGNKTEYALGYSTLYGDMCGGLAVIGDLSKPEVYALSRYYNEHRGADVIPQRILQRPPSAELREGQVDPFDYERISPLVDAVIEEHLSREQLMSRGYTADEVDLVTRLVRINEYKRQQAAPVLRVSESAFGIGRKMPIVNHYPF